MTQNAYCSTVTRNTKNSAATSATVGKDAKSLSERPEEMRLGEV